MNVESVDTFQGTVPKNVGRAGHIQGTDADVAEMVRGQDQGPVHDHDPIREEDPEAQLRHHQSEGKNVQKSEEDAVQAMIAA